MNKFFQNIKTLVGLYAGSNTKPQAVAVEDFATLEQHVAEHAALREVAEAANEIEPDDLRTLLPNSSTNLLTALAKLAAVKGGQK